MFQPEHFPLRGNKYHEAVAKLRHSTYNTHKLLAHFSEEGKPRRWRDVLGRGQDRAFSYISGPDQWHSSGAEEDIRQAVEEVPVLALAIIRPFPQDPARYIVVSTYNGRAAAFNLPQLEPNATWFRRCELLPAELRGWLEDEGVFILLTDSTAPLTTDPDGLHPTRTVSTDVLFAVYQHAGVIKPHFKADRGDLAWQMVYATGYHHRPSPRPKFLQFVGEDHFRSAWPEWREPGWLPSGADTLNPQEEFFLYYEAAGLQLFVSRLLQHGLVYGGMKAVDSTLSLRQMYQVFLEGGETKPWGPATDPLGIRSDFPPPQHYHNIPALMQYRPQEYNPAMAAAEEKKASESNSSEESPQQTMVEMDGGEQDFPPAPAKRSHNSEEGSSGGAVEGAEGGEVELILHDRALETELAHEEDNNNNPKATDKSGATGKGEEKQEHTDTQKKLLQLASQLEAPPPAPLQAATAVAQEQEVMEVDDSTPVATRTKPPPQPLFSLHPLPGPHHLTGANTTPVGGRAAGGPLAGRLGPPNRPPSPTGPPAMDRVVVLAVEPKEEFPSPRYAPEDVRSRLFPTLADGEAFRREAPAHLPHGPAAIAVCRRDLNLRFGSQVRESAGVHSFRERHPHLPFAPLSEDVATDTSSPMDDRRLANIRLTHDERLRNPYVAQPFFDNRCDFCSTKRCSRFVAGTNHPNCKKYREQVLFAPTRRICDYRRCLAPHEHHTVTCPYLHRKCSKCGCRGHDTVDGCDLRNSAVMSRLRSDFEEWANCGLYTRKHFDAIKWGFYGVPSFRPPSNFVSYRRLTDLPVLEAMAFLQTLLLLPENVAASREHAPQPPAPTDGSATDGSPDQPKPNPTC